MTEEKKTVFEFGTDQLNEEVTVEETNYMKFEKGVPVNIEVLPLPIEKSTVTFSEEQGEVDRYNIHIKVGDEQKVWSCSRRVVKLLNDYFSQTKRFKIIRGSNNYDIIPLGLQD